jgi:hypothetical protein
VFLFDFSLLLYLGVCLVSLFGGNQCQFVVVDL